MRRPRHRSATLAAILLLAAAAAVGGCGTTTTSGGSGADDAGTSRGAGSTPSGSGSGAASGANGSTRAKAVKFAECMRGHGVSGFPDPDASGELTIDAVANEGGVDTSTATYSAATEACRSLQPSGFTGHLRTAAQQRVALQFAQCMRDYGVRDFPDPLRDGALIDTNRIPSAAGRGARDIPGFDDAAHTCGERFGSGLGIKVP